MRGETPTGSASRRKYRANKRGAKTTRNRENAQININIMYKTAGKKCFKKQENVLFLRFASVVTYLGFPRISNPFWKRRRIINIRYMRVPVLAV